MLQCRCPPEHRRSSVFATFMEFVIHPVGLRTSAGPSTSEHHSTNGHWSPATRTTPGLSRISRIIHKPQLLAYTECSCRKNLSPSICFLYNSHTKVRCCIPSRAGALHRSESFAKFCNCENAAHRGDPNKQEWHLVRLTLTGSQTVSFLVEVMPSTEIHGSAAPQVKTSCPHSEPRETEDLSHVCFGLSQSIHQHAKLSHLFVKQSLKCSCQPYQRLTERQKPSPSAQTQEQELDVHSTTKHPSRCVAAYQQIRSQDHHVLASCLSSTRFPPTEHGQSHHQSSPLQHGRGTLPYVAWQSY